LWWPPTKIAGRYLSPYLLGRDEVDLREATRSAPHVAVDLPLDGMQ
jgi:hypothetical protein